MNIGSTDSTIRLVTGFALLILIGIKFAPATLWLIFISWAISIYLIVTGIFLICPVYKLLGVNRKN